MRIINLPQDIIPANQKKEESIIFHPFIATGNPFTGKSILHTNAVSLVMTGQKTMHFANKILKIKNDEFHFLSAGNCIASVNMAGKETFSSILIFFKNEVLTEFYMKYADLANSIKNKYSVPNESYVSFKKDAFVANFITSLNLLLADAKSISMEMKTLKFEELMLHLLERYPAAILSFEASGSRDLNDMEIKRAVESNITNKITIEELAFLCNTSLSGFKRRFEKLYGTSPSKWMLQKRIEFAKHLLQHHGEKPGEVYYKVGYENHSSFSQSFKQIVGVTPKNYQQQQLNVQQ